MGGGGGGRGDGGREDVVGLLNELNGWFSGVGVGCGCFSYLERLAII